MKIAQIAPLAESVPPKLYGGTERVVSYLTEELVRLGHDVTLFAAADSETSAELVACAPRALRLAPYPQAMAHYALMLETVRRRAAEFDVLHFHTDHVHLPLFRPLARKTLTTLHGRLDLPSLAPLYREFADMPLVSISNSQRAPLPFAQWTGTVYHGLAAEICPFNPAFRGTAQNRYLAFLGRIAPEKRPDRAIEVARRLGIPLKIAAKVDQADRSYFEHVIEPLLDDPLIEFVGEIGDEAKEEFLGNALALLFPIDWPEPFGIVMIEAMAVGTPVIAWRGGSVPEVVDDGLSGILVESIDEMVEAVQRVREMSREVVRERFEARFTAARMAREYMRVYERSLAQGRAIVPARLLARPKAILVDPSRKARKDLDGETATA